MNSSARQCWKSRSSLPSLENSSNPGLRLGLHQIHTRPRRTGQTLNSLVFTTLYSHWPPPVVTWNFHPPSPPSPYGYRSRPLSFLAFRFLFVWAMVVYEPADASPELLVVQDKLRGAVLFLPCGVPGVFVRHLPPPFSTISSPSELHHGHNACA